MITLSLDWREVLWWMQGGMAGSHLRGSVYEDMVNKVWPQCTEQERRNMFLIMRRDLGSYWRPDGWNGHEHMTDKGEGSWKEAIADDYGFTVGHGQGIVHERTPWMYFRQVLARFDPDNQYAVILHANSEEEAVKTLKDAERRGILLDQNYKAWKLIDASNSVPVRAYKWQDEYRIDWSRRCAEDSITKIEKLDIPDDGTM